MVYLSIFKPAKRGMVTTQGVSHGSHQGIQSPVGACPICRGWHGVFTRGHHGVAYDDFDHYNISFSIFQSNSFISMSNKRLNNLLWVDLPCLITRTWKGVVGMRWPLTIVASHAGFQFMLMTSTEKNRASAGPRALSVLWQDNVLETSSNSTPLLPT